MLAGEQRQRDRTERRRNAFLELFWIQVAKSLPAQGTLFEEHAGKTISWQRLLVVLMLPLVVLSAQQMVDAQELEEIKYPS